MDFDVWVKVRVVGNGLRCYKTGGILENAKNNRQNYNFDDVINEFHGLASLLFLFR